ncbi:MAG: MFS transporter [Halomonas sp.]|nr:MFS transporter [Halomonas sp.]MCC5902289.1 MFS transporter [Halomonas sp.]
MTLWLLFTALLAIATGQGVVMTLLPPLGREVGLNEFQVAIIISSSALVYAVGTTVWGRVSLHFGRRRIILIGLAGYTLGTLLFTTVFSLGMLGLLAELPLFMALLFSRMLQSSIMSATPPAALGYAIALTTADKRLAAISRTTSANSLGQVVGPAFGGLLAALGLLVPLYTVALLTFLALGWLWFRLPDDRLMPGQVDAKTTHLNTSERLTWASWRYLMVAAALFSAMAMIHQTLGFFFIDIWHLSPPRAAQQVGFAVLTLALVSVAVQFGFVQRSRWDTGRMLILGLTSLLIGYMLLAFAGSMVSLHVAMALVGLGMGLSYPAAATAATSTGSAQQQAKATGLVSATPAVGFIIGPLVAAPLYQLNPSAPFAAAAILIAVMLVIHRLPATHTRATDTP